MLKNLSPLCALLLVLPSAQAGYLIEIDIDGADDGPITYNPHFSFGNDTTTASTSAASLAFGLSGADSIFGGDGVNFGDTYRYTYNPSVDLDNLVIPAGTDLGGGVLASGLPSGGPGRYAVYATWPFTENVGGLTTFTATTTGDSFVLELDQNGKGHEWIKLGEINWTSGDIVLSQVASVNSFVSMRAAGVLFEVVPEPTALTLGLLGLLGFNLRRFTSR